LERKVDIAAYVQQVKEIDGGDIKTSHK
jgi:hypothetical protein